MLSFSYNSSPPNSDGSGVLPVMFSVWSLSHKLYFIKRMKVATMVAIKLMPSDDVEVWSLLHINAWQSQPARLYNLSFMSTAGWEGGTMSTVQLCLLVFWTGTHSPIQSNGENKNTLPHWEIMIFKILSILDITSHQILDVIFFDDFAFCWWNPAANWAKLFFCSHSCLKSLM